MTAKCDGYLEDLVLSIKKVFYSRDLQSILIINDGGNIVYHHRSCQPLLLAESSDSSRSAVCVSWFNSLQQAQFFQNIKGPPKSDKNEVELELLNGSTKNVSIDLSTSGDIEMNGFQSKTSFVLKNSLLKSRLSEATSLKTQTKKKLKSEFWCDGCCLQFKDKDELNTHMMQIHQNDFLNCYLCGDKVKNLSKHLKVDHKKKNKISYCCDICGRSFKCAGSYNYHMSGHTGQKNYTCNICNKNYRNSSEQKKCEKAHQGLFKYNCTICNYKTHQKNKFTRHSRIHNKEVPYTCPLCYQNLARKDYLQKHIQKKHPEISLQQLERKCPQLYELNQGNKDDERNLEINEDIQTYDKNTTTIFVIT
jgi:hypothetical protein